MNRRPCCLTSGFDLEKAKEMMVKKAITCLPVIDDEERVVSAVWWMDLFNGKKNRHVPLNLPVVIMAGGEGLRLQPFTNILPKPLMPIGDRPIIEIIIDRFHGFGCNDFYLSLNYKSNIIKAYFNDLDHSWKMNYILEEKPLGTAGGLHFLRKKIKGPFFVSNCDILVEADYSDILKFHRQKKNRITLVGSMKNFKIPYGVCEIEHGGILRGIKEKPEYDFFVNTGMYVLDSAVLGDIPRNKPYSMTDLMDDYLEAGERIGVYPVSEKSWVDIGQMEELQNTLKHLKIQ